jgi:hypothetical protein
VFNGGGVGVSSGITDILALAMGSRGVAAPKRAFGKEQLLALFANKKTDETLSLFTHRIEAITPYKHLFVYSVDPSQFKFPKLKVRIEAAFPGIIGGIRDVNPHLGDLEPQACLADELQDRIYLKLVHQVEMSGWVAVSRTEKKLKEFRKRHPVVITLRPTEGIVTIGFPGFTYLQGVQHDDRIAYSGIAAQGVEFLKRKLKIECKPFNAKPAIDALLEEGPGRGDRCEEERSAKERWALRVRCRGGGKTNGGNR